MSAKRVAEPPAGVATCHFGANLQENVGRGENGTAASVVQTYRSTQEPPNEHWKTLLRSGTS